MAAAGVRPDARPRLLRTGALGQQDATSVVEEVAREREVQRCRGVVHDGLRRDVGRDGVGVHEDDRLHDIAPRSRRRRCRVVEVAGPVVVHVAPSGRTTLPAAPSTSLGSAVPFWFDRRVVRAGTADIGSARRQAALADLARRLLTEVDDLVARMGEAYRAEIPEYASLT